MTPARSVYPVEETTCARHSGPIPVGVKFEFQNMLKFAKHVTNREALREWKGFRKPISDRALNAAKDLKLKLYL